jgi:hypothetical protein
MTPPSSSPLPDLSGLTMLVVDDDEDTLEVLTTMITACGADVLFARSALEGLAYLDTTLSFNLLHKKDNARIQNKRFCSEEGVEVRGMTS